MAPQVGHADGGLDIPHPRSAGAFPRVLGRFVRQRGVLELPEAIAKMTGRSAAQVGLTDRGLLQTGKKADIVIFDPAVVETGPRSSSPPHRRSGSSTSSSMGRWYWTQAH